jgi:sigma-B regulation protein RsbU (phosphoserine phosphatase)
MSLRKRIQILLGALMGIPLLLLLWESYRAGRTVFLSQLKLESLQIAKLEEEGIDLTFEPPRLVAEGMARGLTLNGSLQGDEIRELLRQTLRENPKLYGAGIFLDPGLTPLGRFAPYVFRRNGRESEIAIPYEYTGWEWYRLPVAAERGLWSKPYFDEGGGGTLMVTFSAPIRREGRIVGVATVDLDLDGLVSRLRHIHPGGGGSVYLASPEGNVIAHPDLKALADLGKVQRIGKLVELINAKGVDMTEMKDPVSDRNSWIVETPVESLSTAHGGGDWSLIVSWPLDLRLAPLSGFARRMLVLYLFLGGAALVFLNRSFDQIVSRPLRRLGDQARRYARGDFERQPPGDEYAPELRELSQALEGLGETLERKAQSPKPAGDPT